LAYVIGSLEYLRSYIQEYNYSKEEEILLISLDVCVKRLKHFLTSCSFVFFRFCYLHALDVAHSSWSSHN